MYHQLIRAVNERGMWVASEIVAPNGEIRVIVRAFRGGAMQYPIAIKNDPVAITMQNLARVGRASESLEFAHLLGGKPDEMAHKEQYYAQVTASSQASLKELWSAAVDQDKAVGDIDDVARNYLMTYIQPLGDAIGACNHRPIQVDVVRVFSSIARNK